MQSGEGRGIGMFPQGLGGFEKCRCPNCGYEEPHRRNVPCNRMRCPKCGIRMIGD